MPLLNPYQQTAQQTNYTPTVYGQYTPKGQIDPPFSDYDPSYKVNPYMNLYRTDNNTGFDNYTIYVKPALEAEAKERALRQEISNMKQAQQAAADRQIQEAAMATGGSVYGNLNSGLGASYGAVNPPTTAPAPAAATAPSTEATEKEKEEAAAEGLEKQTRAPNFNQLNPYIPTGANPAQYQVRPNQK